MLLYIQHTSSCLHGMLYDNQLLPKFHPPPWPPPRLNYIAKNLGPFSIVHCSHIHTLTFIGSWSLCCRIQTRTILVLAIRCSPVYQPLVQMYDPSRLVVLQTFKSNLLIMESSSTDTRNCCLRCTPCCCSRSGGCKWLLV